MQDASRQTVELVKDRAPPENLMSHDDLQGLKVQARTEAERQRNHLKDQMQQQYRGEIAEKQRKRQMERQQEEAEVARQMEHHQ